MPERVVAQSYRNTSKRFSCTSNDYSKQYCALYNCRLTKMREILSKKISQKWGSEYQVCSLHELSMFDQTKCIIIGTLFKDQKLKPSVLKQLHSENNLIPQPVHIHFTSETDRLFIEDETQRYKIEGNLDHKTVVTGITCAILGTDKGDGKFNAEETLFANELETIQRPLITNDLYIIFISGLDLVHYEKHSLKLQLLTQWLGGQFPSEDLLDVSQICRVVIAGNSISSNSTKEKKLVSITNNNVNDYEININAVKLLDDFLLTLCQLVDVDIMPGENDPSNHILPQRCLHSCMLPKSSIYKSLNCVSNPYDFEIDGLRILGSSGQAVDDVMRFSDIPETLDALESTLKWGTIAPTAPDTLACFPSYDNDPFIRDSLPNVFFSANHDTFDTRLYNEGKIKESQVRLICVPDFSRTNAVAVLNLRDLSCKPMYFGI